MTQPQMDWDDAYRQDIPPPWSIGAPQPELAQLIPAAGGPASLPGVERDGAGHIMMPGFLLSAHKETDS